MAHEGGGGSKMSKKLSTWFMDGPKANLSSSLCEPTLYYHDKPTLFDKNFQIPKLKQMQNWFVFIVA